MQVSPLRHLRRNAVAYLALFVALGGTSFAAATVITGKNVKDSSLTGADVKKGSLTGSDVKNKSLAPADFNGSVQGATGPQGPKGDTGPQGPKGDSGTNGTNGLDGTARAYAQVNVDGSLVAAKSKGIASAVKAATGTYCIVLDASIDVTKVAAIANGWVSPGASTDVVGANAGGCSFNGTVGVLVIVQDPAGTNVDGPFNLAIP